MENPAVLYQGYREGGDAYVRKVAWPDASPLPLRLDLRNHSPTGFEWGYAGSGPAQLALAILADAVGDEKAVKHHQAFKFERIATLPRNQDWIIRQTEVHEWVKAKESA